MISVFNALLAILLTCAPYALGRFIFRRTGLLFFNPLLIAVTLIITLLHFAKIPYEKYNLGGRCITALLAPATVALALPLYQRLPLLKRNALPIAAGVLCGAFVALLSILACALLFNFSSELTRSLLPKSITTPLGVAVSRQLGGNPPITVTAILLSGMLGAMFAPALARRLRLRDPIARGIAMGTASHAIGTARALELDATEGALSALAMTLCGLATVFLAPPAWRLYETLALHLGVAVK